MKAERGFTLLEVLVATTIMAIAVAGLMSSLNTSLMNAGKLTDHDRAANIARAKMDELLLQAKLPHNAPIAGQLDPALTGWSQAGFRAIVSPFDVPPSAGVGTAILERIQLEIWWNTFNGRRTFQVDAYRRGRMQPGDPGLAQ